MNLCMFVGRLTKEPDFNYSQEKQIPIARFTIAVDRGVKAEEDVTADFFRCVAFDRRAEFASQYLHSGMRVAVSGKLRNENYTNKAGDKVYGISLLADNIEFADGKKNESQGAAGQPEQEGHSVATSAKNQTPAATKPTTASSAAGKPATASPAAARPATARPAAARPATARPAATGAAAASSYDGFMNIPDGIEEDGFPFN